MCHSIPDAHGIAVHTPLGAVIHTGDFKIDHDPVVGDPTDFTDLARIAGDGVFLLLSDSTYAEEEGYSGSDRVAAEGLFKVIAEAEGRVFVASFASQIARVQIAADAARATGRKLAVLGRSMINNIRIARDLGHLDIPQELIGETCRGGKSARPQGPVYDHRQPGRILFGPGQDVTRGTQGCGC